MILEINSHQTLLEKCQELLYYLIHLEDNKLKTVAVTPTELFMNSHDRILNSM